MMRLLAILLLAPFLSSCSGLSLVVRWADTLAIAQIDDYFTFSRDQSRQARAEFKRIFGEVRKRDFPAVAGKLEKMAEMAEQGELTSAKLSQWIDETQALLRAGVRRFEPFGQRLISDESVHGYAQFDREITAQQTKRRERFKDPDEVMRETDRRFSRLLENTFETLTPEQEELWRSEKESNAFPLQLQEESRVALWLTFKEARATEDTRREFVERWFRDWESLQAKAYLEARATYQIRFRSFLWKLWESSTAEQRLKLIKNFRKRAQELRELS